MPEELVLRPLQSDLRDKIREAWADGANNVMVQAPPGFGKTECATDMLLALYEKKDKNGLMRRRGIFACDRIPLITQTSQRFDKYGLDHGVIQASHPRFDPSQRIQLCSVQTIAKREWPETDLLIWDEAHIMPRVIKEKLKKRDCRIIGLSATPFTPGLGKYYDAIVNAATTNHLIKHGWLTPFRIFSPSIIDTVGLKVVKGEWEERGLESRALPVVGDCVAEYLRLRSGKKFVAFVVSVAHAEELQRQFMAAGVITNLYTYRQSDKEKEESVKEFRKPDSYIRGLISIESLTRGFDVPDIEVMILARPLRKSLTVHLQMIGRVLRTAPGKTEATILDHTGNCERFWDAQCDYMEYGVTELDDGKRSEKKKAKDKEIKPRKCSKCSHVHKPRPSCTSCGFEYPSRAAGVQRVAGNLTEFSGSNRKEEMQRFYSELIVIAYEKKFSPRWVHNQFKQRFRKSTKGLGLRNEPAIPREKTRSWVRQNLLKYWKGKKTG